MSTPRRVGGSVGDYPTPTREGSGDESIYTGKTFIVNNYFICCKILKLIKGKIFIITCDLETTSVKRVLGFSKLLTRPAPQLAIYRRERLMRAIHKSLACYVVKSQDFFFYDDLADDIRPQVMRIYKNPGLQALVSSIV